MKFAQVVRQQCWSAHWFCWSNDWAPGNSVMSCLRHNFGRRATHCSLGESCFQSRPRPRVRYEENDSSSSSLIELSLCVGERDDGGEIICLLGGFSLINPHPSNSNHLLILVSVNPSLVATHANIIATEPTFLHHHVDRSVSRVGFSERLGR